MSKYHDDRTVASDAVNIRLSEAKLARIQPELCGWLSWVNVVPFGNRRAFAWQVRRVIGEHVHRGDSRAALVVRSLPLLVAAYTDEQDAVLLLRFPKEIAAEYALQKGSKLLTINTYVWGKQLVRDIVPGPQSTGRYANFHPIIAEFVSDDDAVIQQRKGAIAPAEWRRTTELANAYMSRPKAFIRDGRPLHSITPGEPLG